MFTPAANNRYTFQTVICFTIYGLINSLAMSGAFEDLGAGAKWALGLAVALPVLGHVWATLRLIRSGDEFARALTLKRFILAWGISVTLFASWGFLESYADVVHAPGWLIYPLFWLAFAFITPFVKTSRG
ncbi:hypothetical protein LZK98_17810 [Sphingomonas cannabina]|uniref:hypothetical protein n=1 Tax=Sphingomonas cannabina TaxID=2899123 RepID=UPI001F3DD754|nr:hypothetical protein [Sphingomonas cannabina]UIJ44884.1 hypothetical protein LZK98_17810 [Sphingomonas cannabina]